MMLGGVGYQFGVDEARRKQMLTRQPAVGVAPPPMGTDVVKQLNALKALQDDGLLTPDEFRLAKRKVLDI
jgi:hypothetical protein